MEPNTEQAPPTAMELWAQSLEARQLRERQENAAFLDAVCVALPLNWQSMTYDTADGHRRYQLWQNGPNGYRISFLFTHPGPRIKSRVTLRIPVPDDLAPFLHKDDKQPEKTYFLDADPKKVARHIERTLCPLADNLLPTLSLRRDSHNDLRARHIALCREVTASLGVHLDPSGDGYQSFRHFCIGKGESLTHGRVVASTDRISLDVTVHPALATLLMTTIRSYINVQATLDEEQLTP